MKKLIFLILALSIIVGIYLMGIYFRYDYPALAAIETEPSIIVDTIYASGLEYPVGIYHANDSLGRLFVVEQNGKIKVIKQGIVQATPFLDISSLLPCTPGAHCGERGLLGLAFHPESSSVFFINYTRKSDGATVIARYNVSANPDVADTTSRQEVLVIGQPYANHNGGHIAFGKDGYLYIGMGDGGSGGDPLNNALNLNSLLGKMLRIDVDVNLPGYSIPTGNLQGEIWALGLRNPWSWSFDRQNGDLYIGDVGQNAWEEVDFRRSTDPPGANFGWSCLEGNHNYNLSRPPCNQSSYVSATIRPIAEYSHSEGQSITGGYVYRGDDYHGLSGRYFYADYVYGKIWSFIQVSNSPVAFSQPVLHLDTDLKISCFGEDEAGELYLCDHSSGQIRRLQDVSGASPNLTGSWLRSDNDYANQGEIVDYTLHLVNSGGASTNVLTSDITIPVELAFQSGSLTASSGSVSALNASQLRWQGVLVSGLPVDITWQVAVLVNEGNPITQAQMSGAGYTGMNIKHALLIPRPTLQTTLEDFFFPGTQPGALSDPVMLPAACDVCHTATIVDPWRGSMMSQAGNDPLFWAALEVANHDAPGSGTYCLRCHTPKGWLEGRSEQSDGSGLTQADLDSGVACEICHRAVDGVASSFPFDQAVSRDTIIRSGIIPPLPNDHSGSGMMVIDPLDYRRGPFDLGVNFPYHPNQTYRSDFLGGDRENTVARSRLCGTCHNVDNPTLSWDATRGEYWPNNVDMNAPSFNKGELFAIETTYDEWLNSNFSTTTACQDCHMRPTMGYAAETFFTPVYRDCVNTGCLPVHEFVGGNTWVPSLLLNPEWRLSQLNLGQILGKTILDARNMLRRAAVLDVSELITSGSSQQVTVRVTNLTGHKLPTGYPEGRRMWLNVRAFDSMGNVVFETCGYDYGTGVLAEDTDCVVFEIKQGITDALAGEYGNTPGASFHFVLNNFVVKDNRIPPAGFTADALGRRGLAPVPAGLYLPGQNYAEVVIDSIPNNATTIIAYLYYQTSSKEYIDFLGDEGGVDANTVLDMWQDSKSPPELIAWGSFPDYSIFYPVIYK